MSYKKLADNLAVLASGVCHNPCQHIFQHTSAQIKCAYNLMPAATHAHSLASLDAQYGTGTLRHTQFPFQGLASFVTLTQLRLAEMQRNVELHVLNFVKVADGVQADHRKMTTLVSRRS